MSRIRTTSSDTKQTLLHSNAVPEKWLICVYIRLSKEDTGNTSRQTKSEQQIKSESIKNQKSILISWIEEHFEPETYEIVGFFEDDGLTGTDDTRENFMRMVGTIERGEANCVIVKTLSRAFRNYSDQGYYLEEYFPSRNIRFISTMDTYVDSYLNSDAIYNLDVPMYGVLNDRFAATTSHCVRRTFNDKRAKGIFIGAFAPWGFLKDPEEKGHLILDPDTAPIKIQMKDWILHEGMSLRGVAKRLNSLGIPNPTKDKKLKGWKYHNPHAKINDGLWCAKTVKDVLLNLMNLGHMVQGKQKVVSYKIHNKVSVPESEWYIVEHTHEATFTQEDFDALYDLFGRDTRTNNNLGTVHKFAGLIRCGGCNKAMYRSHGKGHVYFKCRTRGDKYLEACNVKSIREDKLENAVLKAIQVQIKLVGSLASIIDKINETSKPDDNLQRLEKMLADKNKELQKIQNVYDGLYGDWKLGEISEIEYRRMKKRYKSEEEQTESIVMNIKEELSKLRNDVTTENTLFKEFLQYQNITELSRPVLISLINIIYVYENNEITINFRFKDELLRIIEFIEQNGIDGSKST